MQNDYATYFVGFINLCGLNRILIGSIEHLRHSAENQLQTLQIFPAQLFYTLIAMVELPIPCIEIYLDLEALVQCGLFREECIDLKFFA